MTNGQLVRLRGKGAARSAGCRGDLYFLIQLAAHPRYRVQGRDLEVRLPIAPWEAVLGRSVGIATPAGPVRLRVPAGSSSGRRLRLAGRGLIGSGGPAGDLVAVVQIVVPCTPSERERELFRQLETRSDFDPRHQAAANASA